MNPYYNYQTQARGLISPEDVVKLCDSMSPVWMRLMTGWLPENKNSAIYEVGCGPGAFLLFLKRLGYTNVCGSDLSQNQINLAVANGLNAKLADSISELESFAPETFDCLIGIDFIEHISKDVAIKFLQQASRVLKNNGILILRMPNGDSPFVGRNLFNDITHQWAYTTVAIQSLLFVSGFSKASFADEAEASVSCCRCVKIPLMKIAQCVFKFLTRAATREQIQYLSPSIFVFARK